MKQIKIALLLNDIALKKDEQKVILYGAFFYDMRLTIEFISHLVSFSPPYSQYLATS